MKRILTMILLVITVPLAAAGADDRKAPETSRLGLTIDLLPTILSAASGEAGAAAQIWLASGRNRVRFVGATMRLPDGMIGDSAFDRQHLTALAWLVDHFFADDRTGLWLGGGIELWLNDIRHSASGERLAWSDAVLTVGGGWIFPLGKYFYVEPWAGLHFRLREPSVVATDGTRFQPGRFTAEASLKLGVRL